MKILIYWNTLFIRGKLYHDGNFLSKADEKFIQCTKAMLETQRYFLDQKDMKNRDKINKGIDKNSFKRQK